MIYRVVTTKGTETFPNRVALLEKWGAKLTGFHKGARTREELQDQPEFEGLAGPFWGGMLDVYGEYVFDGGGEPSVRYEDWPTYERMST